MNALYKKCLHYCSHFTSVQSAIKARKKNFQTRRGSSGDSLIIKKFYLQNRIEEEQRTKFYQICQERYQGQTQVNFSRGVRYTVEPIGFL